MNKIIFITLLNVFCSLAQNRKITILDSISKDPIEYVNVNFLNGYGIFSNEKGQFKISNLSVNIIKLSHISYESKKIELNKTTDSVILLKSKINKLSEVTIEKRQALKVKKTITVEPKIHKKYNQMYFSAIGLQFAFRIKSNENHSFLKSIEIPLFRKKNSLTKDVYQEQKYPYRTLVKLEILECIDEMPGKNLNDYVKYEIINSENINDVFASTFEKRIEIPDNGLFVLLTFIGSVDENNLLIAEMPYDTNLKFGQEKKFIKWIMPNIPIIERQNDTKTLLKFSYEINPTWKEIDKPIIYNKGQDYPIFDIGIGYKIEIME